MNVIEKERMKEICYTAWQVLIDNDIDSLPVDVVSIANNNNISIIKNSKADILKPTEAGASILKNSKWYIIYDDKMIRSQIIFTIARKLGHVFLGHALIYGYHARTFDIPKPDIEREADMFAVYLCALPFNSFWMKIIFNLQLHFNRMVLREMKKGR